MIILLCLSYLFAYPNMRGLLYHVAVPTTGVESWEGWGGTALFKPYRYVLCQRVSLLCFFDLEAGIDFAHFGL